MPRSGTIRNRKRTEIIIIYNYSPIINIVSD